MSYARIKPNIIKAAEKMPAEDYQFKPTPEARTFARVVNHVVEAQMHACTAVNGSGTGGAVLMPADAAGKTEIVEKLKASFVACDSAYASTTDANIAEMVPVGQGKRSRLGILWGNIAHDNEQYATLALYLRLKGLVPPSSER